MNTESIECRRVEKIEEVGDFKFDEEKYTIYIWIPGSSGPDAIRLNKGEPGGARIWGWNGDEDKPTLVPSILVPGQWHGYLRNGKLESC